MSACDKNTKFLPVARLWYYFPQDEQEVKLTSCSVQWRILSFSHFDAKIIIHDHVACFLPVTFPMCLTQKSFLFFLYSGIYPAIIELQTHFTLDNGIHCMLYYSIWNWGYRPQQNNECKQSRDCGLIVFFPVLPDIIVFLMQRTGYLDTIKSRSVKQAVSLFSRHPNPERTHWDTCLITNAPLQIPLESFATSMQPLLCSCWSTMLPYLI